MITFLTKEKLSYEQQLLRKVADGDQYAFTLLFKKYAEGLAIYVLSLSESQEVTEEIVQDVFTVVWEKRASLTHLENFNNYIFIISKNKTLNYLRQQAMKRKAQMEWAKQFEEEFEEIDQSSRKEELFVLIEEEIDKLPPQQKRVYTLSRVEKLKYEEIAQQLGLTRETVKKHMSLALLSLRTNLKFLTEKAICVLFLIFITFF